MPAWDALTAHLVVAGILAAELKRARSGGGELLRVSLTDLAVAVTQRLGFLGEAHLDPEPRARHGNDLFSPYRRDSLPRMVGRVILMALTPRQWQSLVEVSGNRAEDAELERTRGLDLRRESDRFAARREVATLIGPWISARPLAEVRRIFDRQQVLWGPSQTFERLLAEDRRASVANPLFRKVEQPEIGRVLVAGRPLRFAHSAAAPAGRSQALGQDTAAVLREWLGWSEVEMAELSSEGIIASVSSGLDDANGSRG